MNAGKEKINPVHATVVAALLLTAAAMVLWLNHVRQDWTHAVTINSLTPILKGSGDDCSSSQSIAFERPGTTLRVHRIRYWKDCETIDIRLRDGRSGTHHRR